MRDALLRAFLVIGGVSAACAWTWPGVFPEGDPVAVLAQDFACPAAEGITERLAMKNLATGNLLQAIPNPPVAVGPGDDPRHGLGIRLGVRPQQL